MRVKKAMQVVRGVTPSDDGLVLYDKNNPSDGLTISADISFIEDIMGDEYSKTHTVEYNTDPASKDDKVFFILPKKKKGDTGHD